MVPRIIEDHLMKGRIVDKWVFGRVQSGGQHDN